MVRQRYIDSIRKRTGLSVNRILAAICVNAECIPEIQHLCMAGYFRTIDDQWYLWDLPKDLQQQVADSDNPLEKLKELKRIHGDTFRRRRSPPLHGVWDEKTL